MCSLTNTLLAGGLPVGIQDRRRSRKRVRKMQGGERALVVRGTPYYRTMKRVHAGDASVAHTIRQHDYPRPLDDKSLAKLSA
jgi:hypothetical protein